MNEIKTQNQRLDYLVEEFKRDSVQYTDLETPKDTEGKRRLLRAGVSSGRDVGILEQIHLDQSLYADPERHL
jgi:hypothetical protein